MAKTGMRRECDCWGPKFERLPGTCTEHGMPSVTIWGGTRDLTRKTPPHPAQPSLTSLLSFFPPKRRLFQVVISCP